jgi:hypothetical protein
MKLKIFSDRRFLPDSCEHASLKYVPLLFPFWGKIAEDPDDFRTGLFDSYLESGHSALEMTSLEAADLVVLPAYWHLIQNDEIAIARARNLIDLAQAAGKQIAVFVAGDWEGPPIADHAMIFFTSSFRTRLQPNEFAMPGWSVDFALKTANGQLAIRPKQDIPTVGFCGYAPPLGLPFGVKRLKATARMAGDQLGLTQQWLSYRSGHTTRVKAIKTLRRSQLTHTNFILRGQFAFTPQAMQGVSQDHKAYAKQLRQEFCQNMIDSDYVLCASGYENYSIRFYETLSCGRIPIFIDTDCVLPYQREIDWQRYCVWVQENELSQIDRKVADFHAQLSPQAFADLQRDCREIWEDWISPEGFFSNIYRCFDSAVSA